MKPEKGSLYITYVTYWHYYESTSISHICSHQKGIGKTMFRKESARYPAITQNQNCTFWKATNSKFTKSDSGHICRKKTTTEPQTKGTLKP